MNIYEKLSEIQAELKAPKNQRNNFGGYDYRSCEDILEAVKPLCKAHNVVLNISDEIVMVGERYYVRATATLIDLDDQKGDAIATIENVAYAREEENKKGMDASQVTGATSSYARKYALNGLFCIDDTKDADTDAYQKQNKVDNKTTSKPAYENRTQKPQTQQTPKLISDAQRKRLFAISNGNNEVVKRVLERYKYEKTEQIKMSDYEQICNEIEAEITM